jgi:acyl carrier protein phosphodiesterase
MIYEHLEILPDKAQKMFSYMSRDNWLLAYSQITGIEQALGGMSRRTKFESGMERAGSNLISEYDLFKSEFETFFPDLISHTTALGTSWE